MKASEVREHILEKKELTYKKIIEHIIYKMNDCEFNMNVETNLVKNETFKLLRADGYDIDMQKTTTRIDWSGWSDKKNDVSYLKQEKNRNLNNHNFPHPVTPV